MEKGGGGVGTERAGCWVRRLSVGMVGMELSADTRDQEDPTSTTRGGAMRCPASRRLLGAKDTRRVLLQDTTTE
jgi:hypothetical protein